MTPSAPSTTRVIAVVGPTAVGKTALAEEIAVRLGGQIVSADSMQVYRGMDIGTAKPALADRRVPYHCIDLVDPGQPFSAALFQRVARDSIEQVASGGHLPVVAGGTGLYVRAALDTMEFPAGEQADNAVRDEYEAVARERGPEVLHALLSQRDPASAALIHPNNVRRVVRALEMADQGISYAQQAAGFSNRVGVFETRYVGLDMDRQRLYERIDARVDSMVACGLLGEVEQLLAAGFRSALTASAAIGYKEFVPVIESGADMDGAIAQVKQATRRYAKRQLTWFRSDPRISWFDAQTPTATAADAVIDGLDWSPASGS
ncbi:MAG: tRNA (adenosine(37)-N6)-dimethylallyltransferase MiaA [Coriobacteriia bacterium]|nr:tRNA (adenosine(37)-N6)-dimethylallyltransferase MiaA [Coriobacteriia bacterium]